MILLRRKSFTLENPEGVQGDQTDVPTDGSQVMISPQQSQAQAQQQVSPEVSAQQSAAQRTNDVTSRQLILQQMTSY